MSLLMIDGSSLVYDVGMEAIWSVDSDGRMWQAQLREIKRGVAGDSGVSNRLGLMELDALPSPVTFGTKLPI